MIAALARASAVFDRPEWLERARRAFAFITAQMMTDDRLAHSWRAGRTLALAFLEDYANMASAALALFEHTAERGYLHQAERWTLRLDADYLDREHGGYFQVPAGATDVLVRVKNAQDGPTPAGNGTLLAVLARLHLLTGERRYRERAERLLAAFSGEAARNPTVHAALLSGTLLLERPVQIVVIGAPGDPACAALRRVALTAALPAAVTLTLAPGDGAARGSSGRRQSSDRRPAHGLCLPGADLPAAGHRPGPARGCARARQPLAGPLVWLISCGLRRLAIDAARGSLRLTAAGRK